jgi:hypothetical protein
MTYNDMQFFNAALRQDFRAFLHRSVLALNPGGQFLPNWHIDAIALCWSRSGVAKSRA